MNLYIAHPITGLVGSDVWEYYNRIISALQTRFHCLHPIIWKEHLNDDLQTKSHGYSHPLSNDHAIFQRDTWMVSISDVVLIDLSNCHATSIGCCMELAVASWLNKHTVVVMEADNKHRHAFVLEAADVVFDSIQPAIDYLIKLGGI